MALISHNPNNLFPPYRSYSHAIEVPSGARLLFISGLNGYLIDGKTIPESFEEQGHNVWRHIGTLLHDARTWLEAGGRGGSCKDAGIVVCYWPGCCLMPRFW